MYSLMQSALSYTRTTKCMIGLPQLALYFNDERGCLCMYSAPSECRLTPCAVPQNAYKFNCHRLWAAASTTKNQNKTCIGRTPEKFLRISVDISNNSRLQGEHYWSKIMLEWRAVMASWTYMIGNFIKLKQKLLCRFCFHTPTAWRCMRT